VEEAEEGKIEIKKNGHRLTLETDWFPGEKFDLKMFFSPHQDEMLLIASFERETIFLLLE
jgi:hypothetical protein